MRADLAKLRELIATWRKGADALEAGLHGIAHMARAEQYRSCAGQLEAVLLEGIEAPTFRLDAYQLRCASEFAAPDYEKDEGQRETELLFQDMPARVADGEEMPGGMYCWYADYPEEGVLRLEEYGEYQRRMIAAAGEGARTIKAKPAGSRTAPTGARRLAIGGNRWPGSP